MQKHIEPLERRALFSASAGALPPVISGLSDIGVLASSSTFSDTLNGIRQQDKVPGIAAMAAVNGRQVLEGAAGFRARGSSDRIRVGDLFHLGSNAKAMTATMIARLDEKGVLSLDNTVAELIGKKNRSRIDARYLDVTMARLLGMRGGVREDSRVPASFFVRAATLPGSAADVRRNLMVRILQYSPQGTAGRDFHYSNSAYMLAAAFAERIAGKPFEQLMREEVFEPLGMSSPIIGSPRQVSNKQPAGHASDGELVDISSETALNPNGAFTAAGDYSMTLQDWMKFSNVHAGVKKGYLTTDMLTRLHKPLKGPGTSYALGWFVEDRPFVGTTLAHDGTNGYWYSRMVVIPSQRTVMLMATNQGAPRGLQAVDDAMASMTTELLGIIG